MSGKLDGSLPQKKLVVSGLIIAFAAKARGAAMSLAAFCFMGGGGVGTAIGGKVIDATGFNLFYLYYGLGLIALAAFWVTAPDVSKAPIEAVR
jgi:predicted MFS family arabinose efflux permease